MSMSSNAAQLIFSENFNNQIECFHLSESEFSNNLVGIAIQKKIILGILKIQVNDYHFLNEKQITRSKSITLVVERTDN